MLSLKHIQITRDNRSILSIDDLSIDTSGFTLILGHNGSGKSTLAKILSGQLSPDSGEITLNNTNLNHFKARELAKEIGYLGQYLPQVPGLTVTELVKLGRFPWRGLLGRWQAQDKAIIQQAIEQTDMSGFSNIDVDQLSGGEKQRAWIAMLLAQQAKTLILDEPTAALDIAHQYELLTRLKSLHKEQGIGVIVVLHDINLALRFAGDVLAMQQGQVVFHGNSDNFAQTDRLSQLFNVDLQVQQHPTVDSKVVIVC